MTDTLEVRKGSPSVELTRDEFRERFRARFLDPMFETVSAELGAVEAVAWESYRGHHKAPRTRKAGKEFADPSYDLSLDWLATRAALHQAKQLHDASVEARVLVIAGGARNEHTCPGEQSKTQRLVSEACDELRTRGAHVDLLDLSEQTAEYGRQIHPCKACVSTAMPLCHWPCSCYPNHGLGQTSDWMAEIYPRWVAAHGVAIITPTYYYQAPATLKLMIDRMVCSDGGNPDPTTTHGKDPAKAKAIELAGWGFPKHLAGRAFAIFAHGDASGTESLRRNLHDWLTDMALVSSGPKGNLDRFIGYLEPYASSHEALDKTPALVEEVRMTMGALVEKIAQLRAGVKPIGDELQDPRPK
ncbi:flavodoxin family protein [soil metagenome]